MKTEMMPSPPLAQLEFHYQPADLDMVNDCNHYLIKVRFPENYSVKSDWKKGVRFAKQFPQETQYRHSLPEESDALTAAATVLEKIKEDAQTAKLVTDNPTAGLLLKLYEAGLIDPYVLFSLGDDDIAKDYLAYRGKNRDKLETYMDKFVMPPAPAKP